jgi:hypothetical protein
LNGEYRRSTDWKAPVALVRADPVLNFTFRNDFPLHDFPPLSVHWRGFLQVPKTGLYRFLSLTTDSVSVKLDGRQVDRGGNYESGDVFLREGPHRLEVYFLKSSGMACAFTLAWKKPGDVKFEVIPHSAFRRPFSVVR